MAENEASSLRNELLVQRMRIGRDIREMPLNEFRCAPQPRASLLLPLMESPPSSPARRSKYGGSLDAVMLSNIDQRLAMHFNSGLATPAVGRSDAPLEAGRTVLRGTSRKRGRAATAEGDDNGEDAPTAKAVEAPMTARRRMRAGETLYSKDGTCRCLLPVPSMCECGGSKAPSARMQALLLPRRRRMRMRRPPRGRQRRQGLVCP